MAKTAGEGLDADERDEPREGTTRMLMEPAKQDL